MAGAGFGAVVTAQDAQGNTATTFTGNVTLAITSGTGKAGANLRGTATVAAVSGVATFSGLSVDSVGSGYTLTASATGPTSAVSGAFAITRRARRRPGVHDAAAGQHGRRRGVRRRRSPRATPSATRRPASPAA